MTIAATPPVTIEPCTVCDHEVLIGIARADGYDGLTDNGDPVCTDHWCPVCHLAHDTAELFQACLDDPECLTDPDTAYDALTNR